MSAHETRPPQGKGDTITLTEVVPENPGKRSLFEAQAPSLPHEQGAGLSDLFDLAPRDLGGTADPNQPESENPYDSKLRRREDTPLPLCSLADTLSR